MPAKNMCVTTQWKRKVLSTAVMLAFFGIASTSHGDTGSSVPPTVANTPAAGNTPRASENPGTSDIKRNSVVFKKKGRTVKKIPDCTGKEPCNAKKYVFRSKRPDESGVGVGVSANNNKQSAKVRAKVPF